MSLVKRRDEHLASFQMRTPFAYVCVRVAQFGPDMIEKEEEEDAKWERKLAKIKLLSLSHSSSFPRFFSCCSYIFVWRCQRAWPSVEDAPI